MASFRVLTPLRHDGATHAPGAIVSMDASAADRAMAIRAVSPLEPGQDEPGQREPGPGQTAPSLSPGRVRAARTGRKTP
ncbi:MAG: hypothetical protein HQL99_01380 [Magnetococcales bacterium]|nr:hypothetical protein [Magnetococcales bacterium]